MKTDIDYVNNLIADLRKCSCADCEGAQCRAEHCDEHANRAMREAANVLKTFMENGELNVYKSNIVKMLIGDLERCARTLCGGCVEYDSMECTARESGLMCLAADMLEMYTETLKHGTESDRIGQNRTYTVPEIIRLVQHVVSNETCGMDAESMELCIAYEVERGIVAELVKEKTNE